MLHSSRKSFFVPKKLLYKKQEIINYYNQETINENIDYALDYLVMNNEYLVDDI